jgi:hypothetical protein
MRYSILSNAFAVQDIVGHPDKARHSLGGALYFEYSLTDLNPNARTNAAQTIRYIQGMDTILGKRRVSNASLDAASLQPTGMNPPLFGSIDPIFREDDDYYYLILINSAKDGNEIPMRCSTIVPEVSATTPVVVDEYRSRRNFANATVMPSITAPRTITEIQQLTINGMNVSWETLPTTDYRRATINGQTTTTIDGTTVTRFTPAEIKVFRLRKSTTLLAFGDTKSVGSLTAESTTLTEQQNQAKEEVASSNTLHNLECSPNPVHREARISFTLQKQETVSVILTDILGQEIVRLKDVETMSSGNHSINLDLNAFPAGVYQCRLFTKQGVQSIFISHYQ